MTEIIISCIIFLVSAVFFCMSILSFCNRGFLFNNAYLYASQTERKFMNKKPYYRQSAITFLLIAVAFLLIGLAVLLELDWLLAVASAIIIGDIIYAAVSSAIIEKKK